MFILRTENPHGSHNIISNPAGTGSYAKPMCKTGGKRHAVPTVCFSGVSFCGFGGCGVVYVKGNDRLERLENKMTTYVFDYAADRFDAEQPVQTATLEWSTVDGEGCYHRHSLRMEHHAGDGFKAAKRAAVDIVSKDRPGMVCKVRDCWRKGKVYASFLVDVIG